jgi:hypothetical protein
MNTKQITFKDWTCDVRMDNYQNDRVALMLTDVKDASPIATATVNIPEANLEVGEVIIKSWSENNGMAEALIAGGIIGPELGKIPTGHVVATVHELLI